MITYKSEPSSPVVEIHVSGAVTNADLEARIKQMRDDVELHGKTRILEFIDHFTGIEPSAIWTDITLGMPLANQVTHVALVADRSWIRAVGHLGALFMKAKIRTFEPDQAAEAREWIAA
ncbi:MAG TPA: STAS/SEC14 domain-containing protein [Caulobacteraceae bacterium]|nr:STAS/SEC14 domain-containing protein [Caulobacteraceae bacterium]